jgi:hypothetical protein
MRELPLLVFFLLSSCTVGNVQDQRPQGTDATLAPIDASGLDASWIDPDCTPEAPANGNGQHNAGANCGSGNCHDGLGAPPKWSLAGTLYVDPEGSAPVVGGTLVVLDSEGTELVLTTATNGNFYTLEPLVFPLTIKASRCPNSLSMKAEVPGDLQSCNQGGCHEAGKRIYLPQ